MVVNAGGGGDPEGFGWDDGVVGVRILIMLLKKFVEEYQAMDHPFGAPILNLFSEWCSRLPA